MKAADLDGDGDQDIIGYVSNTWWAPYVSMKIIDGQGTFAPPNIYWRYSFGGKPIY